jgi:hypothetical protein
MEESHQLCWTEGEKDWKAGACAVIVSDGMHVTFKIKQQ